MLIESGIGNGKLAGVDSDNRILTASFNIPFEHLIAKDYRKVFSVQGTATPVNGATTVLLMNNNSESDEVVIHRVFLQAIVSGGTALPNISNYFTLETDSVYASGGTLVTPVNLSSGSAVVSNVTAYSDGAALAGAPQVAMTQWPFQSGVTAELALNGGVLLLPGKGMSIGYSGDNTAGIVSATVAFSVVGADGYSG